MEVVDSEVDTAVDMEVEDMEVVAGRDLLIPNLKQEGIVDSAEDLVVVVASVHEEDEDIINENTIDQ